MWNNLNGQLLKTCESDANMEIAALAYVYKQAQNFKCIIGGGWNKRVVFWDDNNCDFVEGIARKMETLHTDIISIEYCPPSNGIVLKLFV